MKKYIKSQLVEPTAWLCVIIGISATLFPVWFTWLLCAIGIALPEDGMKAWCARRAPTISAWLDKWIED